MKKVIIGLVVVVIVAVAVVVGLTTGNDDKSNQSGSQSSQSDNSGTQAKAVQTNEVTIKDFKYAPAVIKVKPGTKVTWVNQDSTPHTVTSDDGSSVSYDSGNMDQDDSYSRTFNQVGSFDYHCTYHPYMHGTVIVEQ